jgi:hypothetical protein
MILLRVDGTSVQEQGTAGIDRWMDPEVDG